MLHDSTGIVIVKPMQSSFLRRACFSIDIFQQAIYGMECDRTFDKRGKKAKKKRRKSFKKMRWDMTDEENSIFSLKEKNKNYYWNFETLKFCRFIQ